MRLLGVIENVVEPLLVGGIQFLSWPQLQQAIGRTGRSNVCNVDRRPIHNHPGSDLGSPPEDVLEKLGQHLCLRPRGRVPVENRIGADPPRDTTRIVPVIVIEFTFQKVGRRRTGVAR